MYVDSRWVFSFFDLELIPALLQKYQTCVCVWSSGMCYTGLCWELVDSKRQLFLSYSQTIRNGRLSFWSRACSLCVRCKFSWKPQFSSFHCAPSQMFTFLINDGEAPTNTNMGGGFWWVVQLPLCVHLSLAVSASYWLL